MAPREPAVTADARIGVVAAALAVALCAPALFFGQVPIYQDFVNVFLPFKLYAAHAIGHGRLPLWAAESFFGTPFVANYQCGVLYPPSWIIALLPGPTGVGLYLAFHYGLAGAGAGLFFRRHGYGPRAALLAPVLMILGGVPISIAPWAHLAAFAWIPWSLIAGEELVRVPSPRTFSALVAVLTLELLCGAPETFAQGLALMVLAARIRAREPGTAPGVFRRFAVCLALALGLAALQLAPTAQYAAATARGAGLAYGAVTEFSLHPRTLLTLLVPHRIDAGQVGPLVDGRISLFWSIYLGIVPLGLVSIGAASAAGIRLAVVLGSALILALGDHSPVYPMLFAAAPRIVAAFRYPEKFLITAHLAAVALSVAGLSRVEQIARRLSARSATVIVWAILAASVLDLWDVHSSALLFSDWRALLDSAPRAVVEEGSAARVYAYERDGPGIGRWTLRVSFDENLRDRERSLWTDLIGNVPLLYGVGYVRGQDGMARLRPAALDLERSLRSQPLGRGLRLLRSLGVNFLTGESALGDPSLEIVRSGDRRRSFIYRLRGAAPRVYFARRLRGAASTAAAFRSMSEPTFVPGEDAVLPEPLPAVGLGPGQATIVADEGERLEIDTRADEEGVLVVGDSEFPGWRAEIDGRPAGILPANGMLRALIVPGGVHRVRMTYAPRSFRAGAMISLAALGSLVGILLSWRRVGRSPGVPETVRE